MIRFNLLYTTGANAGQSRAGQSRGFLDVDADTVVAFKRENEQYNWAEPSTGRTVEFSVPGTDVNRKILDFADDPVEYGGAMRIRHDCQMQYPGGAVTGRLDVTKFESGRFSCVFYYPYTDSIDRLNDKKLADCKCTFKGITWNESSALDADDAWLPTMPLAVIKYDGTIARYIGTAARCWLPSVNAKLYIENILDNLGIAHDLNVSQSTYLVSPTINGASEISGVVAKTGLTAGTIDPSLQNYLEFNQSAHLTSFGVFGIPTHTNCWSIRPKIDVEITFPVGFPSNCELIHVNGNKISFIGDYYRDGMGWHGNPLGGRTVSIPAGKDFFIVEDDGSGAYGDGYANGWHADASPYSYTLTIARSGDIQQGDVWKVQYNAPDMTVVEFLRSLALMEGKELFYDVNRDCVIINGADVGSDTREEITGVIEAVSLTRNVDDWGSDVREVVVCFDSEDYVTKPVRSAYPVATDILEDVEEKTVKWSEGNDSGDGEGNVYVEDCSFENDTQTIRAKKWTAGVCGDGQYLKRVSFMTNHAANAIATAATCLTLRIVQDVADFLGMTRDAYLTWRGMAYIWTSAEWSEGVTTIKLQAY